MTESQFQRQVIELARLYGWLVHHCRPARVGQGWRTPIQGDKGFPDLCLCNGRTFLVVELKSDKGTVSPEQEGWIHALRTAGVDVRVWRPSSIDEVIRTLTERQP